MSAFASTPRIVSFDGVDWTEVVHGVFITEWDACTVGISYQNEVQWTTVITNSWDTTPLRIVNSTMHGAFPFSLATVTQETLFAAAAASIELLSDAADDYLDYDQDPDNHPEGDDGVYAPDSDLDNEE